MHHDRKFELLNGVLERLGPALRAEWAPLGVQRSSAQKKLKPCQAPKAYYITQTERFDVVNPCQAFKIVLPALTPHAVHLLGARTWSAQKGREEAADL